MYEKVLWVFKRTCNENNWIEKEKNVAFNKQRVKAHEDAKICYIWGKYFINKLFRDINYPKIRDYCYYTGKYRGPAHSIYNLKFNVPNEIPVVLYNGSKYDYHFNRILIKELANVFEGPFECIGENC